MLYIRHLIAVKKNTKHNSAQNFQQRNAAGHIDSENDEEPTCGCEVDHGGGVCAQGGQA